MSMERPTDQEILEKYESALRQLNEKVIALLEEVADECDLSENEVLGIAIVGLHQRMKSVREGRVYLSVPADTVEFYTTPAAVLMGEAHPAYADVYERLSADSAT
ncbi:hypothetical protein [Rhodococcus sp. A5(2022)]|uniref:hypothetical protein n=1 Tax=Rhodococcus sp. A5(2022) TaxID=3003588 RepID=UPI0022A88341|nr:hypothetical protein [Rhodococcus sp. A5(2022)]MCZ1075263.1 hypothetical protein [Rhodococcus sp. A5(2022)]